MADQYVVVTLYRQEGKAPLIHVYGAPSLARANSTRAVLLQHYGTTDLHVSVCKVQQGLADPVYSDRAVGLLNLDLDDDEDRFGVGDD